MYYSKKVDFLSELNPEQRQAAEAGNGPVMIVAGPGTGKTKTLVCRLVYLIISGQAKASEILALTFTNKAAKEMQARTKQLLKEPAAQPRIATFHALSYELMSSHHQQPLTFIPEGERLAIIGELRKTAALKQFTTRELAMRISRVKATPDQPEDAAVVNLAASYTKVLRQKGVYDFDDLLLQAHDLLKRDAEMRGQLQTRYRYVLVDEFQDTNEVQYSLLCLINNTGNILVIGDPRQSIYGFRGARARIFSRFAADFPTCQTITLTQNYRSAPAVVALGNAIFPDAPPLRAQQLGDGVVQAVQVLNEYTEAAWVINQIEQAMGGTDLLRSHALVGHESAPYRFADFAILYRTHRIARHLQRAFGDSGLPYQVAGEASPYEQSTVQRIIEVLRRHTFSHAPLPSGFSDAQFAALAARLSGKRVSELAAQIASELGLMQEKPELKRDLQQFIGMLVRFDDQDTKAFLAYHDVIAEQYFYDPAADAISLLTIHAAKGLEFKRVFLLGAEEGVLPHEQADSDEERRLFYVAATRAKQRLDILYTKNRGAQPRLPSRFVRELPATTLPRVVDSAMDAQLKRAEARRQKRRQATLF